MEEMKSSTHLSRPVRRGRLWAGMNGAPKSKAELMKLRSALLKRTRTAREQCVVPDKLLYRYDVGEEGAMVVSFSSSGHILAIAARGSSHYYSVPLSREGLCPTLLHALLSSTTPTVSSDHPHPHNQQ